MVEEDPQESPPVVSVETGEDGTTRRTETTVRTPPGRFRPARGGDASLFLLLPGEESHKDHHHPHARPLRVRHALPGRRRLGDGDGGVRHPCGVQAGPRRCGAQYRAPQLPLRAPCGLRRLPGRAAVRRLRQPEQERSHGRPLQVGGASLLGGAPGLPWGSPDRFSTRRPVHPDGYRTLDPSYRAHSRNQLDPYAAQPQVGPTLMS